MTSGKFADCPDAEHAWIEPAKLIDYLLNLDRRMEASVRDGSSWWETHGGTDNVSGMIAEHDVVVLTGDVPSDGLKAGDVGVVLLVHGGHGDVPPGYTIEVTNLLGDTVAIVDVPADLVRPVAQCDVRHARSAPISA